MSKQYLEVISSPPLKGIVSVFGAKNATLPIIASLLLTKGTSVLHNVPASADILQMINLLEDCGALVEFDKVAHQLTVTIDTINSCNVCPDVMGRLRASILVMGPLLARHGQARVSFPGGCAIGARPIDFHLQAFRTLGVKIEEDGQYLHARASSEKIGDNFRVIFDYPSVGATENILMYSALGNHTVTIVNASYEPEVLDLITVLTKMGAYITCHPSGIVKIVGVKQLQPIEHEVIPDRLEAATLLLAGAISGGQVTVANAQAYNLDIFLDKLAVMGHHISWGDGGIGITLKATKDPQPVSFSTGPYPGFPTDLQAPMIASLCVANGKSLVTETVYENRFMHLSELEKMGALYALSGYRAYEITGGALHGTAVDAHDIRGACSLVLAGLVAQGVTHVYGLSFWRRCFDHFEEKLRSLGALIQICDEKVASTLPLESARGELQ